MATKKKQTPKKATGNKAVPRKKPSAKKTPAKKAPATKKPRAAAKPKAAPKKVTKKSGGKMSALDAAVQVLAKAKEPLTTKEMIEQMASKNLWKSPGGKTPHATLYSAILREINTKKKEARFTKTERGKFAAKE